jgi:EAL domain-containing protein (putative c-di-GMP-specific phosphodiesterase class I)
MLETRAAVAAHAVSGKSTSPLCFLVDADFAFRQEFAKEIRRNGIEVVEFSTSARFVEMVDDQRPDIVFISVNPLAPEHCVRSLLALKECAYSGVVQLYGNCQRRIIDGFKEVGDDCSLTMLPPIAKPTGFGGIYRIILDNKLGTPSASASPIALADALTRNLVNFLYLPKLDLNSNMIVGVEVVARVAVPGRDALTPNQFLKGADEEALIKLSRMALVDALRASAHFHKAGSPLRTAINIGVDNLLRLPIADLVQMHRPECNKWPGLVVEIPERQVSSKIDILKARSPKLQQSGVAIAIDNFGTGSCPLGVLNQIHFSEIKIDRSLVQDCATNQGNKNICKTLIDTAHNFGAQAVAVGIASEADLTTLSGFGCDIGQGFLIGKPMTLPQVDLLIANFKSQVH